MAMAQLHKQEPLQMSEAEYLEFEKKSEIKHEFVNGKVYAMAGASLTHTLICQNTATTLANQLADTPCLVVANDLRLKVDSKVSFRYPDVMVICDEPRYVDDRVDPVGNPQVVVEVLSHSTALVERNEKLDEYTRLDSVHEYVLISQYDAKIERYTRAESGEWRYKKVAGLDSEIDLPSIHCALDLSKVYNKVTFKNVDES